MADPIVDHANDPILIAGFGSIGRRHFGNLRALGYHNFVFYRTFQATIPDAEIAAWPSTSNLAEALARKPRIAVISNPSSRHLDVALAAAEAGCHLFIEKPLSHSLDGCQRLAEIVQQKKLTTMIGCQYRFHPLLISLERGLSEGRLGQVLGRGPNGASTCPIGTHGRTIDKATVPEPIWAAGWC